MLARYQSGGVAALVQKSNQSSVGSKQLGDLSKAIEALGWFIPAARFFYLMSNRTWERGSVPEAIRRTLSLPIWPEGWKDSDKRRFLKSVTNQSSGPSGLAITEAPVCPVDIREACLAREKAGQQFVPQRIARQITASAATVRQHRNPREAALDFLNSPGGMRLVYDASVEGEYRLARAGEIIEADDATVNFPVCVPWQRDGSDDPCVQKYGVKVARFQWLVTIDVGTSYVTNFSYTARPRSSYRAEDITSLLRNFARTHGVPRKFRFERGAWESKLVTNAVKHMGAQLDTVYSPHQKPFIEGLFNTLWTKLSVHFPGGHVGRSQGEEREANLLFAACRTGAKDPRRYFPMLQTALEVFHAAIAEKNRTPVFTAGHGSWIPEERWIAEREAHLGPLRPESDWMFAPFLREWTVKGMLVGGRVPMFEGVSVPFDFSAPWLPQFNGAKVRCHFDPADPKCSAKIILAQPWLKEGRQLRAGSILGDAPQVNQHAGYVRLVMGWGDDPHTAGLKARQQASAQLRREVRAVLPRGQRGDAESEERDGLGTVSKIETGSVSESELTPHARPTPTAERSDRLAEAFADPLEFT